MCRARRIGWLGVALVLLVVVPGAPADDRRAASVAQSSESSVPFAGSVWRWGYPRPHGEGYEEVDLAGERGYALGAGGTVFATGDGGASFSAVANPRVVYGNDETNDHNGLQVIDANTVVTWGCSIARSDDGAQTFRKLALPRSDLCLSSVNFVSDTTGFVAYPDEGGRRGARIFATDDGGRSFGLRGVIGGPGGKFTLRFFDQDTGIALNTNGPEIYRTADGGRTWTLAARTRLDDYGLAIADTDTAFAVSREGALLQTDNRGVSWTRRPLRGAGGRPLIAIACVDDRRCLVLARGPDPDTNDRDGVFLTTDGGATVAGFSTAPGVRAADFSSATRAVAVGYGASTSLSEDGGRRFARASVPARTAFAGLQEGPNGRVYALGRVIALGRLLGTSANGGRSWTLSRLPARRIEAVAFATPRVGFVAKRGCIDGCTRRTMTIYRTVDSGKTWRRMGQHQDLRAPLLAVDARRLLTFGAEGFVRSSDGGRTLHRVRSRLVRKATGFHFDTRRRVAFAFGPGLLAVSSDAGRSWRRIGAPAARIAEVEFPARQTGYLRSRAGVVFKTVDRGATWRRLSLPRSQKAKGLSFSDANHGFLDVSIADSEGLPGEGAVLKTADGGRTWVRQYAGSPLTDLVATGPSSAAASNGSSLIWTDEGLLPFAPLR